MSSPSSSSLPLTDSNGAVLLHLSVMPVVRDTSCMIASFTKIFCNYITMVTVMTQCVVPVCVAPVLSGALHSVYNNIIIAT